MISLTGVLSGTKKLGQPDYSTRPTGPKHRQRFLCEVRVDKFDYVGAGNSTNKKDAMANAARDFCSFLVRSGQLSPEEVPGGQTGGQTGAGGPSVGPSAEVGAALGLAGLTGSPPPADRPNVFGEGFGPRDLGPSYLGRGQEPGKGDFKKDFLEEAEDADSNCGVHGNWSLENSKSMLHQFLQTRHIQADYSYSMIGQSFLAEMSFYVRELSRTVAGRGQASTKHMASKTCALSLVRQLYHLKVIQAFSGTLKKNKNLQEVKPYEVAVSPELVSQLEECVKALEIDPVQVEQYEGGQEGQEGQEGVSLIPQLNLSHLLPDSKPGQAGIVSWSPPQQNWNPWLAANIDEGPLASVSLQQISEDLNTDWRERQRADNNLQAALKQRETLPIFGMKREIMAAIKDNPVTLIRGNTGCGKTTQVCQYILDHWISCGQGSHCNIVCTQPRRISAVSVADRVSAERAEQLGVSTGYSVRFESVLPRPYGSIMFCTVGVLLRKLEAGLRGISHVIVDEIHERDVNSDFLLVVLRDMIHTFPDLRIILMSATINTSLFSNYFGNCPIVEVPGRVFPVQEYFLEDCIQMTNFVPEPVLRKNKKKQRDNEEDEAAVLEERNLNQTCSDQYSVETRQSMSAMAENEVPFDLITAILDYIRTLHLPGAVLVFLPGWSQIFALLKTLQQHPLYGGHQYRLIPLHSQLPREDQRAVFDPVQPGVTKIILSTNIAESSLTIEDVVFVIDCCRVKLKVFTAHNNMTNYTTTWASKTNLLQRRGRAGRVRAGFCFHLVSRARLEALQEHIMAEIFRTPLQELALSIKLLRLGDVGQFLSKCLEPPPIDAVIEAEVMLREMLALDRNDELTPLGRILAKLPLEPRLGKMLVLGAMFSAGDGLTTIAAASSTGAEVFLTDLTNGRLTFRQRNFAGSKHSDHLALLNTFQSWENARQGGEMCEVNFCDNKGLNMPSLRVVWEAKTQLRDILLNCGFPEECFLPHEYNFHGSDPRLDMMVALLSMGLYPNVCLHQEKRKVFTAESKVALVHKSSVNCSRETVSFPLPFFVFNEKLRTRAVTCKGMTMVSPIHLMLFACRKMELMPDLKVRLDGWLSLSISPRVAALVAALRPGLECLVVSCAGQPGSVAQPTLKQHNTLHLVRQLVQLNAARHNMDQLATTGMQGGATKRPSSYFAGGGGGPPAKRGSGFNSMFGGRGYGYGGGFRGGRGGRRGYGGGWGGYSRGGGRGRGGF